MDYLKNEREELQKNIEEYNLLKFLSKYENIEQKIKSFYCNSGDEKLKKFAKEFQEGTGQYFNLHFNKESGLIVILVGDSGLELDRKEFTWANKPSNRMKQPFLEILKEYKSILELV